jgi:hypothetical protein
MPESVARAAAISRLASVGAALHSPGMDLDGLGVAELDALYCSAPLGPLPAGLFTGRMLRYLDTPPLVRALDWLLFDAPPYGIDFDARLWWFVHPRLAAGRFELTRGASRWRDTETLRLSYERSLLPGPIRGLLYDEVKPLDETQCLGIGGINRQRGRGEHFFFSLTRASSHPARPAHP